MGWLGENLRRNGYLAEIVNVACHSEAVYLFFRQSHFLSNGTGEIGYTVLVAGSIGVSRLNSHGHSLYYPLHGFLQFPQCFLDLGSTLLDYLLKIFAVSPVIDLQFSTTQRVGHIDPHLRRLKGLDYVTIGPHLQCSLCDLRIIFR